MLIVPVEVMGPPDNGAAVLIVVTVPEPPEAIVVLVIPVTRPWASVVITGTCVEEPYVPGAPTLGKLIVPAVVMVPPERPVPAVIEVTVPDVPTGRFVGIHELVPEFHSNTCPPDGATELTSLPCIFTTLAVVLVPVTSLFIGTDIVVLATPVTLPSGSVVSTGTCDELPYVPAVPISGMLMVPVDVMVPPLRPVPAVIDVTNAEGIGMVVLVTLVTRPCASVVNTGTCVDVPYVPGVPVFGILMVPVVVMTPPERPTPAVIDPTVPGSFVGVQLLVPEFHIITWPAVGVVVLTFFPCIFTTFAAELVPVTSPAIGTVPVSDPALVAVFAEPALLAYTAYGTLINWLVPTLM